MFVMKSAQMKGYGSREVIEVNTDTPAPKDPSAGKVLVRVKAAGVNPVDWKICEGYMQQMMIPLQFPSPLGMDFSGTVEKVGDRGTERIKLTPKGIDSYHRLVDWIKETLDGVKI
jgi:NADPH:quinone reductase-like Zn-dependent oxidoreductase